MHSFLKCFRAACCVRDYAKRATDSDMKKFLNVAEKNDAAKTISGLLSNGTARCREGFSVYNKVYDFESPVRGQNAKMIMTSVSGHLMHLEFLNSYRNWRNVDPRSLFDAPIRKSVGEDYQAIKRTLEREVRGCQGLIIWTDCDREGENIGYEIIDVCRAIKPSLFVYRASFSEITTTAVRRALQQLGQPDKRQSDAVDVRTELDLRTGAAITRFQTMRLQRLFPEKIANKLISYGSCQIPTLGFVVERYKEIEAFVSEAFWKIRVLHTIEELTVEFNWARNRLFDKEACENYLLLCLADPRATVESVTVKPKHKWRPTPMDTVEMEKLGSRKLKLSAKETMTIAEKLYTSGIISYPRTETNQFSKEFELAPLVQHQTESSDWGAFAQRVLEWGPNPRNGSKSDMAHPPIHPTKLVTNLSGNEARVYELIVRHFLACVSRDAVGSETVVNIDIAGEKFSANGLVIHERNYLDVYVYDKWSAKQIHSYTQGQVFEPTEIMLHEGATTAPPLLTEADLITLMDKHGIGTDATHAEHINTIKERGYIGVIDKGFLVPGVIGMGLYEGYDAMELALAKPLLRAEFEADLKRICLGEKQPSLVLAENIRKYKDAYQQIMEKITAMDEKVAQRIQETPAAGNGVATSGADGGQLMMQELHQCPKCQVAPLALKPKKNQTGHFIGCLNFPDCKNVVWLPEECKEPSVLEECCSRCGDGYKLLKFKLNTAYYRTIFNAPHGWYKTCLRCDAQFRTTFNINLDCLKRVGGIVGEAQPRSRAAGVAPAPASRGQGRQPPPAGRGGVAAPPPPRGPGKQPPGGGEGGGGSSTLAKPKKTTKASSKTSTTTAAPVSSIRSYFTSSATPMAPALATATIDDFFDSNEDDNFFEQQLLATVASVESSAAAAAGLTDDIAAAFADDDDADFEALVNGGSNQQPPPSPPGGGAAASLDTSLTGWMREARQLRQEEEMPAVWGSRGLPAVAPVIPVRATAPPPKRARPNDDWPRPAESPAAADPVLCSGCHQPARQHTVRRDGPNQGRQFYKCPKPDECKFFQWADEQPPTGASSSHGSGDSRGSTTSSWGSNSQTTSAPTSWGSHNNSASTAAWGSQASTSNVRYSSSSTVTITQKPAARGGDEADQVMCNCGKPANNLTVRKDGPNQGRNFYACATREKSCGFFKWADVDENAVSSNSNNSWGSSSATSRQQPSSSRNFTAPSSSSSSSSSTVSRARRCGLCRQEGHTKAKCPRKNEFEY